MTELLVIANETIGGRRLLDTIRQRAKVHHGVAVRLVVPQSRPRHGSVIYVEAARDAAQARLELALAFLLAEGIEATGEVGDPDPFAATIDAIDDRKPDEIIISTLPATASGWLRRDLVERVAEATGLPVQHVVTDLEADEDQPYDITLVVANQTADSKALLDTLKSRAGTSGSHLFLIVVPQSSGEGNAANEARAALAASLASLHAADLLAAGMIGDPDPFTATMNALQFFRVDRVIISTLSETRSGWLRADLIERVRRYAVCPVEHVVSEPRPAPAKAIGA
jgi:hypothetical protein